MMLNRRRTLLASFVAALGATACGGAAGVQDSEAGSQAPTPIVFPVQDDTEDAMEALLRGSLTERDGCLYVRPRDSQADVLPIWPNGFSYERSNGVVRVLDADGEVVAEVGSEASLSGGMAGDGEAPLPQPLAARTEHCEGPFWLVGEVIGSS